MAEAACYDMIEGRALALGKDASTIGRTVCLRAETTPGIMIIRLLSPADYRSMPWKNGGGRTTQIASHPPAATHDNFLWRVSIADVASDGPFSLFPGVERTIVLLDGAGMRLTGGQCDVELRTRFAPYRFSGDEAIECTLLAGPVRDFNAMIRRSEARGSITVVAGDGVDVEPADFLLAYAAVGAHACEVPGREPLLLGQDHAVLVERSASPDAPPFAIRPRAEGAVALVVSVEYA